MVKVNVFEAKARLSEYLDRVARGEQVIICHRNRPVAELRAIAAVRTTPRPIGGQKGRLHVPSSFNDPLPEDVIESFEGGALYPPLGETGRISVARESAATRRSQPRRPSRKRRS
jgi:antitoxin (DNA-binding transcriptional repressor) of toxin-antitoxin stability system